MISRLIDADPFTQAQTWYHYNPAEDSMTIQQVQEVGWILERNKRLAADTDRSQQGLKESWQHVASIPNALIDKWYLEERINVFHKRDWPKVRAKLNDPEFRFLRTGGGRL